MQYCQFSSVCHYIMRLTNPRLLTRHTSILLTINLEGPKFPQNQAQTPGRRHNKPALEIGQAPIGLLMSPSQTTDFMEDSCITVKHPPKRLWESLKEGDPIESSSSPRNGSRGKRLKGSGEHGKSLANGLTLSKTHIHSLPNSSHG